jgi:putative transposase
VWSTDITYVRLQHGFLYLVAVLDWYSRYVLAWELSNTLDTGFCLAALETALAHGRPEIFNTDQGVQFTSVAYTSRLEAAGIQISWDGRGRALVDLSPCLQAGDSWAEHSGPGMLARRQNAVTG